MIAKSATPVENKNKILIYKNTTLPGVKLCLMENITEAINSLAESDYMEFLYKNKIDSPTGPLNRSERYPEPLASLMNLSPVSPSKYIASSQTEGY